MTVGASKSYQEDPEFVPNGLSHGSLATDGLKGAFDYNLRRISHLWDHLPWSHSSFGSPEPAETSVVAQEPETPPVSPEPPAEDPEPSEGLQSPLKASADAAPDPDGAGAPDSTPSPDPTPEPAPEVAPEPAPEAPVVEDAPEVPDEPVIPHHPDDDEPFGHPVAITGVALPDTPDPTPEETS